jgi:hypothetical protein
MPWVSTLTTPFLNVNRSGRTSAAKLTGSWRKTTEATNAETLSSKPQTIQALKMVPDSTKIGYPQLTRSAVRLDVPVQVELAYVAEELRVLSLRVPQLQEVLICKLSAGSVLK